MPRFRNKITFFQAFGIVAVLFFGSHMVYGYFYCVYSEYANCPNYMDTITAGEEEEDDFDD